MVFRFQLSAFLNTGVGALGKKKLIQDLSDSQMSQLTNHNLLKHASNWQKLSKSMN